MATLALTLALPNRLLLVSPQTTVGQGMLEEIIQRIDQRFAAILDL